MIDGSWSRLHFAYTRINPAAGGPTNLSGPQFGMRPAFVPKTKWSLGTQYEFSLGERGTLTPRIDVSYQGDLFTSGSNASTNLINEYTLANARLTWRDGDGDWETSLEVTNLTDEVLLHHTLRPVHADGHYRRPAWSAAGVRADSEAPLLTEVISGAKAPEIRWRVHLKERRSCPWQLPAAGSKVLAVPADHTCTHLVIRPAVP